MCKQGSGERKSKVTVTHTHKHTHIHSNTKLTHILSFAFSSQNSDDLCKPKQAIFLENFLYSFLSLDQRKLTGFMNEKCTLKLNRNYSVGFVN